MVGGPLRISSEGITLELERRTVVTFYETLWIKDLAGFQAAFGWKGCSSLKPCLKCRNCMMKGHASCTRDSWQIDITCTDYERLDLYEDAEVFEIADLLEDAHNDPRILVRMKDQLEKAHGFNHTPNGNRHAQQAPNYILGARPPTTMQPNFELMGMQYWDIFR